ncbi:MAG: cytochrome o ubiquinol oxidase subunit III [Parachlamydiales bacterium]|jgi:cytochrome o ubiquinol oxidase subunit 3
MTVRKADAHNTTELQLETYRKVELGFWLYLMTDCILFSMLFATYGVLHTGVADGPTAKEIFSLPYALVETLILLTSSLTCGLAMLSLYKKNANHVVIWLAVTFILGASFLAMELTEFTHMIEEGHSWQQSAFLSSFFTLVSTHGLHITFGLLWILVMIYQVLRKGLTYPTFRRMTCLSLFWHFLDLIWIFIFTFVYLMGVK